MQVLALIAADEDEHQRTQLLTELDEAKKEAGMGKGKGQAASKKKLPRKAKEEASMGKDEAGKKGKRPGEASAEEDMGKVAGKKVPRKAEHKGSVRLFL